MDRDFFEKGEKDFHQLRTYADTKLALIYFSIAMAQKSGRRVNMADPGIVDTEMIRLGRWFDPLTDIFFRPFCNSPARGARPAVNAPLLRMQHAALLGERQARHTAKAA